MNNIKLIIISWNIRGGLKDKVRRSLILERLSLVNESIILLQEPGLLDENEFRETIWEMRQIFKEHKIIYSKNTNEYGGIMTILTGEWVHRYVGWKEDTEKLARYHRVSIRGKNGHVVDIFNIYRPHFKSTGLGSVAEYHRRHLEAKNKIEKSAEEYWEDNFEQLINESFNSDAEIIVAGDFNKTTNDKIKGWTTMKNLDLTNVLEDTLNVKNQATRLPGAGPAIDHIYASKNMVVTKGQIMEQDNLSDHLPILVEFSGAELFFQIAPRQTINHRKVHSANPFAVDKFRDSLDAEIRKDKVIEQLENINRECEQIKVRDISEKERIEWSIENRFSGIVDHLDRITIERERRAAKDIKGNEIMTKKERDIRNKILAWRRIISWTKYRATSKTSKTEIKRLLRIAGQKEVMIKTVDTEFSRKQIKAEWGKWRQLQDARHRRNNEWRFYIQAKGRQTLGDKREVEVIIKTLKNANTSKTTHSRIKTATVGKKYSYYSNN